MSRGVIVCVCGSGSVWECFGWGGDGGGRWGE